MFRQGEIYRHFYIEMVSDSPLGQWGIGSKEDEKFLLQYIPLLKSPPQSLIDQYLSLDHPLLIPHLDVYQESGGLIFVRPYVLIENLIHRIPIDQKTAGSYCTQLAHLETYLKNQSIPMKILYHPENIGLTDEGELRVLLCGTASYMRCDFSDRETFRKVLVGEKEGQTEETEQEKELHVAPPPPVRKSKPQVMVSRRMAVLGAVATGILCFGAGLGVMKVMQKPEETAAVQAESTHQVKAPAPEQKPEAASDPNLPKDSTPPTQEDIDQSQTAAEEFVFSLDQNDQGILKKKARSMTVLPDMEAKQIDSRPGEIAWEIEAEVYHSDGNMKGDMYRTTFRVVTVKENGSWQVKDAKVTGEKKE